MKLCLHISWHKRRRQLTFLLAFKPRNCPPTTPMGVTCSKPSSIKKENDDQPIYSLHFPSLCPQQFCTVVFTLGLLTFHFFMNAMIVGISILLFKSNILKHQNSCIAWISTLEHWQCPSAKDHWEHNCGGTTWIYYLTAVEENTQWGLWGSQLEGVRKKLLQNLGFSCVFCERIQESQGLLQIGCCRKARAISWLGAEIVTHSKRGGCLIFLKVAQWPSFCLCLGNIMDSSLFHFYPGFRLSLSEVDGMVNFMYHFEWTKGCPDSW